ncbi:MAG: hypothetical protein NXI07_13590, partial [bacterium]|nr:hypothetical protein [bacterium]
GAGLAVIAGDDDMIQPLTEESGVLVVSRPTPEQWADRVRSVVSSRETAQKHASMVREYIRTNRRSALHIESLCDAYSDLAATRDEPSES